MATMTKPLRVAGMASMDGRERVMHQAIESLLPQVDVLWVYCNDATTRTRLLTQYCLEPDANLRIATGRDRGDAGKFAPVWWGNYPEDTYIFTVDDDLVYPPDYCERLVHARQMYGRCGVGVHAARFTKMPVESFANDRSRRHCASAATAPRSEHLLGTGTLCVQRGDIELKPEHFENGIMADIWFGLQAQIQRLPLRSIIRERGWIQLAQPHPTDTLWDRMMRDGDEVQREAINRIGWVLR